MPIPRRRVPSLLEFQARDQYESRHGEEEHAEEMETTHATRTNSTTMKALEVGEYEAEQVLEHGGRPKDWNGNVIDDGSQRTRPANSRKGRGMLVAHVVCLILSALHGELPSHSCESLLIRGACQGAAPKRRLRAARPYG